MTALSHAAEYAAVREAIQLLTTLDGNGKRRDIVSFAVEGMTVTYASDQLDWLQQRERELAGRISQKNLRKRTTPDFSSGEDNGFSVVVS
jgi:hypothetical protein